MKTRGAQCFLSYTTLRYFPDINYCIRIFVCEEALSLVAFTCHFDGLSDPEVYKRGSKLWESTKCQEWSMLLYLRKWHKYIVADGLSKRLHNDCILWLSLRTSAKSMNVEKLSIIYIYISIWCKVDVCSWVVKFIVAKKSICMIFICKLDII